MTYRIHTMKHPPAARRLVLPAYPRSQQGSTLLGVLLVLARRKKLILLVTMGLAAVACAISFLLPSEYTATIVILPPQQGPSLSSALGDLGGASSLAGLASSALGMKNVNDMYVSMLQSESVEDAVIQKYGLLAEYHKRHFYEARKRLEWFTTVENSKKDGLIRLSFEDHNPTRAAEVANGYVDTLRSLSQHLAFTEAAQRRVVFEQLLEKSKTDLANSEEALKKTQLSTGFVEVGSQARALIESAARLRAQIVAKEVQIQAMRNYAGEENPALLDQQQALQGLRDQFNKLVGSSGSSPDDLFLSKGNVPEAELEYVRKVRDVKYNEAVFEVLAKQLELAKIDEAKEGGFLQIVNPAFTPEHRSFPKRMWITLGAAAFGLSLGIVFVLLEMRLAQMRANPAAAEQLALLKDAVWSTAPLTSDSYNGESGQRSAKEGALRSSHVQPHAQAR
jgi:tyrosine-protein kinase Etk/Wzc